MTDIVFLTDEQKMHVVSEWRDGRWEPLRQTYRSTARQAVEAAFEKTISSQEAQDGMTWKDAREKYNLRVFRMIPGFQGKDLLLPPVLEDNNLDTRVAGPRNDALDPYAGFTLPWPKPAPLALSDPVDTDECDRRDIKVTLSITNKNSHEILQQITSHKSHLKLWLSDRNFDCSVPLDARYFVDGVQIHSGPPNAVNHAIDARCAYVAKHLLKEEQ